MADTPMCPKCGSPMQTEGELAGDEFECGMREVDPNGRQTDACRIAELSHDLSEAVGLMRRLVERECPIGFVVDAVAFLARLDTKD